MLSPNFYLLIGAIESAHAFITRYYRDVTPGADPEAAAGDDPIKHKATGDPHLDPIPGRASQATAKLPKIKDALLRAEGDLSVELFKVRGKTGKKADTIRADAWKQFSDSVTEQSFVFAKVVRRLKWVEAVPPEEGTGAPEWEMMDQRLRRILQGFAEVGLGGGEDDPAAKGPGILGSSDESFSF